MLSCKNILILLCMATPLIAENIQVYQYSGVEVKHEGKSITLEREISPKCLNVSITSDMIWEGLYANENIPVECKATVVTIVGQIKPMSLHPKVETYGEMEVMRFAKHMQKDDSMMLIDARLEEWFDYRSIPGAINIPHIYISSAKSFQEGFKNSLKALGINKTNGVYDFTEAKTIALFGNGAWCSQSPLMIKYLLALGYPAEKVKWYRGGMHDWLTMSMTSTNRMER